MDFKKLQAMGAFVPQTLTKITIPLRAPVLKPESEWDDPGEPVLTGEFTDTTMEVWIRKRSSADFLEMVNAPDREKAHIAVLRCVCNEDGTEVFPDLEACKQMREWLFIPLFHAVNKVNEFGIKNSKPRTSSGASSRSFSAAPSRKLKSASRKKSARPGSPTATSAAP